MDAKTLLERLFPDGREVAFDGDLLFRQPAVAPAPTSR